MTSNTRIYLVTDTSDNSPCLVKASTPAQALRHITEGMFTVKVPTQDELVGALEAGAIVEMAKPLADLTPAAKTTGKPLDGTK